MTDRTFLVAVHAADPAVDLASLKKAIKENPDISSWWNYIPFVYLVTSGKDVDKLSASLSRTSNFHRFLVTEVNLEASQGLLPERAWKWIRRHSSDSHATVDSKSA